MAVCDFTKTNMKAGGVDQTRKMETNRIWKDLSCDWIQMPVVYIHTGYAKRPIVNSNK
jgi:hypothetical protein